MNILYGVPGEGMGHATRSQVVIDFLLAEGHNVQVVSSARAYQFLHKNFPGRVHEIKGFHFAYKHAQVSRGATFMLNLRSGPGRLLYNFSRYLQLDKQFEADLVISDFESFSFFYARHKNIPCISIDNMQVMDRCKLELPIPAAERSNYKLAKGIVQAKVPGAHHYFISSFFEAEPVKKNSSLVPPIIRPAIVQASRSRGTHILMYQTSSSFARVQQVLHQLPDVSFKVYGFNKEERDGNVQFKAFSESGFVQDLASARAVIANGGFSFISEAVYLQKPVYSFPLQNQFEQWLNAAYIQKLGYGRHFPTLDADGLKAFLYDLPLFEQKLSAYRQEGNAELFSKLRACIAGLA